VTKWLDADSLKEVAMLLVSCHKNKLTKGELRMRMKISVSILMHDALEPPLHR